MSHSAAASGRSFGTAVSAATLRMRSHGYGAVLGQCSSITPEWSMKWDRLCPKPGRYDFGEADRIADFARSQGRRLRGHTLLWHL
ncbi:MAG: endo-1,4-beta-xylanase, partial [Gemmatimonadaceae bacterium]|nr:endo-1,4-beta-xylanase [Gemmatimonadaceae bacterium]